MAAPLLALSFLPGCSYQPQPEDALKAAKVLAETCKALREQAVALPPAGIKACAVIEDVLTPEDEPSESAGGAASE
jgi:hypothetical protein